MRIDIDNNDLRVDKLQRTKSQRFRNEKTNLIQEENVRSGDADEYSSPVSHVRRTRAQELVNLFL